MVNQITRGWPVLALLLLTAAFVFWGAGDAQAEVGTQLPSQDGFLSYPDDDVFGIASSGLGAYGSGSGQGAVSARSCGDTADAPVAPGLTPVGVPSGGLTITEGGSLTYRLHLSCQPAKGVVVQPSVRESWDSDGARERVVTVAPTALVFTADNWNRAQTVTVSVSQNDVDDGDPTDSEDVITAGAVEHHLYFGGTLEPLGGDDVQVKVRDDGDTADFHFSTRSVSVDEGDRATYLVNLTSDPAGDVTVDISAEPPADAGAPVLSFQPGSLDFTSENWRVPQTVVVEAVRDNMVRSRPAVNASHSVTAVDGAVGYSAGMAVPSVQVTVRDNDTRGLSFSPEGLVLAEGESGTYTVWLKSKPVSSNVTVTLSAGGALAKAVNAGNDPETEMTFSADDPANSWDSPQIVTVTAAAPDSSFTGVRSGTVTHSFSGGGYSGSETFSVRVFDSKRSTTSPLIISGGGPPFMTLNETGSGRASTYRVRLRNAPSDAVTVSLASSDTSVAKVSPSTLAFDAGSSGVEQLVTVTAEPDTAFLHRDRFAQISHSLSGALSGSGGYVGVKVLDADPAPSTPEVRFVAGEHCALSGTVPECSGVPEGGTGEYSVQLSGLKPNGTVTLRVDSSYPSAVSVSPDVLHFTPSTWLVPQTVTVRSNGDGIVDDAVAGAVLTHRVSGGGYDVVSVPPVEVSVSSTPDAGDTGLLFSNAPILVSEGESGSYGVRLKSKPAGVVTVFLEQPVRAGCVANGCDSSDSAVSTAAPQFSLDRSQMVFTPSNWDTAQIVRVTTFDDDAVNGTRHFSIGYRVSSGSYGYLSGVLGSVALRITDDDRDGVVISTTTITLQPGATGTYAVRLASEGSAVVSIVSEHEVSPDSPLDFNPSNWSQDQVVTVTAPDDADDFTISHVILGKPVGYVFVRVVAGTDAGVEISPSSLSIDAGSFHSYGVRLSAQPSGDVVITASVSDSTVATVSGPPLTFTTSTWKTPQTVTVTGVSAGSAVIRHTANGGGFSSRLVGVVRVVVTAVEPLQVLLSQPSVDLVSPVDGSYRLVLNQAPTSTVTVVPQPQSGSGINFSPPSVALDASNWSAGVAVRLTPGTTLGDWTVGHALSGGASGAGPVLRVRVTSSQSLADFSVTAVPERAGAPKWAYVGDDVTVIGPATSGVRGWAYLVPALADSAPSACLTDFSTVVPLGSDVAVGGFVTLPVPVSLALFDLGSNYVCFMDADGKGRFHKPIKLEVVNPPEIYRVLLENPVINVGGTLPHSVNFAKEFRVFDGKQGAGENPWKLPQDRGKAKSAAGRVVSADGQLHHCKDVSVNDSQVGCEWGALASLPDEKPWLVPLEPALDADLPVEVPGDQMQFRLKCQDPPNDCVPFGIFWGPVDFWRLLVPARVVDAADFAIHAEHGAGLHFERLDHSSEEDGYYEFSIPRSSANERGQTFVSLVRCNDDHLSHWTGLSEENPALVDKHKSALADCAHPAVAAPSFSVSEEGSALWTSAWGQHDVLSGYGLGCVINSTVARTDNTPEDTNDNDYSYNWTHAVDCDNDDPPDNFTRSHVTDCDTKLRTPPDSVSGLTFTDGVAEVRTPRTGKLKCGFGPPKPFGESGNWGTATYNATRSFYGFVIDWQRGYRRQFAVPYDPYLLEYERCRLTGDSYGLCGSSSDGAPNGTSHWNTNPALVEVPVGTASATVHLRNPRVNPAWSETERPWYSGLPMHFGIYVSGMPATDDWRTGNDVQASWRRVYLGAWDWKDDVSVSDSGGIARLPVGLAFPRGGDSAGDFLRLPTVGNMLTSWDFEVPRSYADKNGEVHLFVVPCIPWYAEVPDPPPTEDSLRRCVELTSDTWPRDVISFERTDADGPFGVDRKDPVVDGVKRVDYSRRIVVRFADVAPGLVTDRPVAIPVDAAVSPSGECKVTRSTKGEGTAATYYWRESLTWMGGCDVDSQLPVDVKFENVSGADAGNFLVYATGGRSDGLDLTKTLRYSGSSGATEQLARLGLLERLSAVPAGAGTVSVKVTPDMAGSAGEVYLLAFECAGSLAAPLCPRVSRPSGGGVAAFNIPYAPTFVVRVKWTEAAGLTHSTLGPVCQGDDCEPTMPVLRAEAPSGACRVAGYDGGFDDLTYWPDRVVAGGACSPSGNAPLSVVVPNSVGYDRPLVFYATGGGDALYSAVQVERGPSGVPAGAAGLRRLAKVLSNSDGGEARLVVAPHMADDQGRILIFAYDCDGSVFNCPTPTSGAVTFDIAERPLFQVLVQYDADDLPQRADLIICEGDECRTSYGVGRRAAPTGTQSCKVSSFFDGSEHVWPLQLVAGGSCDRDDLNDVSVSFDSLGAHRLVVYATGGRSDGLGFVQVKTTTDSSSVSGDGSSSSALPYYPDPMYVPLNVVDGDFSGPGSTGVANVTDGGSLLRAHNTQNMRWVHSRHVDLYNAMAEKSWVEDGLTDVEKSALDYLLYIAVSESSTAAIANRVIVMPFLAAIDGTDVLVLRGLNRATAFGFAARILDHTALSSGITDAQRVLVIGASTMSPLTPSDVGGLLSNGYAGRVVTNTSSGVQVTAARRIAASQSYVPTVIADAMRGIRAHMGSPFPVDHIVALGDSASVLPGAAGVNYGFAISYLPRYEVADSGGAADQLKATLVHEVAHYYWRGAQPWVNEGMASAFEVFLAYDFNLPDSAVVNEQRTCTLVNLRALVRAAPSLGDGEFYCNYYLGQRLFLALHEAMGETAFMVSARALYAEIRDCQARRGDRCGDIDDVLAAFSSQRELVEQHWGGTLPPVTGVSVPPVAASNDLGRLGLFENRLTVTAGADGVVTLSPDQADVDGNIYLLAYVCDGDHGGSGCPILGRPALTGYALGEGPDFAVQVRFTEESGLEHSNVGTVCQGSDCSPPTPILRAAAPDSEESCSARVRTAAADDLTYWPDRVISGGGCDPKSFEPITFTLENGTNYQRPVVVYSTGGGDFPSLQLRRSGDVAEFDDGTDRDAAGAPSGKQGLKRDVLTSANGSLTVNSGMADSDGNVWLLGYDCGGTAVGCPAPLSSGATDPTVFNIEQRPLFQVLAKFAAAPAVIIEPRELSVSEGGSSGYTVRLATKPSGTVTVAISVDVLGALRLEPSTLVLEFTPNSWDELQTVTVRAVDNDDATGDRKVKVLHAVAGADYGGKVCSDGCPVTVSIEDDDAYGAVVSRTDLTIQEGTASEPGTGEYTIVLRAKPTSTVTVTLTAVPAVGVVVAPATVTFDPSNWKRPKTVTVTAVYDDVYHSPLRTARITHAFSGGGYDDSVSVSAVNVTVVDAQLPSVGITGPGGAVILGNRLVMRVGETRDYELSLGSRPAQSLTMSLSTAPSGVVSVSPGSLTFSTTNWSAAQTVTITANAVGEAVINHQGSGEVYDRVRIPSIQVEVLPASAPGAALSPVSPMSLPKGATGQYRLTLTQRPTDDVTVSVTSGGSAATVSPTSVLFNVSNWWRGHDFTVTAGDDVGSVTFTHDFSGGIYDGLADLDMTVNVVKSEGPGIIIGSSRDDSSVVPSGDDPAG